jgi:hypothetical protein
MSVSYPTSASEADDRSKVSCHIHSMLRLDRICTQMSLVHTHPIALTLYFTVGTVCMSYLNIWKISILPTQCICVSCDSPV